jgi:hypothetical protein
MPMKPAPKTPEWDRFTNAVRQIVSVPKSAVVEMQESAKEQRKAKRASASLARASRAKER